MFKTRVITAIIFAPALLLLIYLGSWPLLIALGIFTGVGVYEYGKMMTAKNYQVPYPLLIAAAISIMVAVGQAAWWLLGLIFVVVLVLLIIWAMRKQEKFPGIMLSLGGIMYIGIGFGFVLLLRLPPHTWSILILVFLLTWATDVGAYLLGSAFGKKKLAPAISPNKTVAGAVGGVICAAVTTLVFGLLFVGIPWYLLIIIGVIGSLFGQFGDLFESMIKRWSGIKDSGGFFPGHGGVLDRFDSVLFVAPTVYFLLMFFNYLGA
ncbi:MAG: phosphatidate cytidylyltransferase [Bacillota bacterium]|jgi:phosphatidate cytidylyltransferase